MQKPMVEGMTSCGDWVAQVIEQNENLEQLILVEASELDIQQINVKNQSVYNFQQKNYGTIVEEKNLID